MEWNIRTGLKKGITYPELDLAVLEGCNPEERWKEWKRAYGNAGIPGSKSLGCGLNALLFLSEISHQSAINALQVIPPTGTPMDTMIHWLNLKGQDAPNPVFFTKWQSFFIKQNPDGTINHDETRKELFRLYKQIFTTMPSNSCLLFKMIRYQLQNIPITNNQGNMLSQGHSFILSKYVKDGNEILASIDPQQGKGPHPLKLDQWERNNQMVSPSSYAAIMNQKYIGMELVVAQPINCNLLIQMCSKLQDDNPLSIQIKQVASKLLPIIQQGGNHTGYINISNMLKDIPINNTVVCNLKPRRVTKKGGRRKTIKK